MKLRCVLFILFLAYVQRTFAQDLSVLSVDPLRRGPRPVSILNVSDYDSGTQRPAAEKDAPDLLQEHPAIAIRLRSDGRVASLNPAWNVCTSGKRISKGLLESNRDTYEYRRPHLHLRIPLSCRDYHKGDPQVWTHPDFPGLELTLDHRGRLIGGVPFGYIAVRDGTSTVVAR